MIHSVIASGVLGSSIHQIELFKYLIEAKYNKKITEVKAYSIAVDVLGRGESFDSSIDSIVRVEMFRLRGNLREFNQLSNTYRLDLAKASYNIKISHIDQQTQKNTQSSINTLPPKNRNLMQRKTLLLLLSVGLGAFLIGRSVGSWNDRENCSNTLPNVAISNTPKASKLELYVAQTLRGATAQFSHVNIVENVRACRYTGIPGYEIQYTIFQNDTTFRSTLSALADKNQKIIVTQNFSGALENEALNTGTANDELYYNIVQIANDWLKPNGAITKNANLTSWQSEDKKDDYSCLAMMYDSYISDSDETYHDALNCLERSYENDTAILDNLGGLASSYLEQAQNLRPQTQDDPLTSAANILDKIGEQWSQSVETTVAKILFETERPDYNSQRMRDVLLQAEKRFGSNPAILTEVSKYAGFRLGDWNYAKKVAAIVMRLQSDRDNAVYLVEAADALLHDNSEIAIEICASSYSENSRIANLLVNACAIKNNDVFWQNRTEESLERFGLSTLTDKVNFIQSLNFDERFKQEIIDIWKNTS